MNFYCSSLSAWVNSSSGASIFSSTGAVISAAKPSRRSAGRRSDRSPPISGPLWGHWDTRLSATQPHRKQTRKKQRSCSSTRASGFLVFLALEIRSHGVEGGQEKSTPIRKSGCSSRKERFCERFLCFVLLT
ncbi:unnamed protein product [Ixodes persulcatus]